MNREDFIAGYKEYNLNRANGMNYSKQGADWAAYVCEKEQRPLFDIVTSKRTERGSEAIEEAIIEFYEIMNSPLYKALR